MKGFRKNTNKKHTNKKRTYKRSARKNKTHKRKHRGGSINQPIAFQTYSAGNPQQEALNKIDAMNQHQHRLIHGITTTQTGGVATVPQFMSPGGLGYNSPINPNTLSQHGNNTLLQGSENSKYDEFKAGGKKYKKKHKNIKPKTKSYSKK